MPNMLITLFLKRGSVLGVSVLITMNLVEFMLMNTLLLIYANHIQLEVPALPLSENPLCDFLRIKYTVIVHVYGSVS